LVEGAFKVVIRWTGISFLACDNTTQNESASMTFFVFIENRVAGRMHQLPWGFPVPRQKNIPSGLKYTFKNSD
jgi:hypothetical protein